MNSNGVSSDGPKRKVALITGITGQVSSLKFNYIFQDGSYLAEFLLSMNYIVTIIEITNRL